MMAKTRVIELHLDNTFEDKKVRYEVNQLKPSKKEKVMFEPICVFKERKKISLFSWLRPRKSLILYVNGAHKALRFDKVTDKLQPLWTKKEAGTFVKKQVAKSLEEAKPMTWTQFFILLGVNVVTLLVLFAMAQRFGVF